MRPEGDTASGALDRLERLFALGGGAGANRPGLGAAEQAAHELVAGWMQEAGLVVSQDAAGNLYGRLTGSDPAAREVWTGSHLDSVPDGGRFDGALGVVGALAAVERLERPLARTVTVVAFRDEEGGRFGGGCFGSRALCGVIAEGELEKRDAEGVSVADALAALGLTAPPASGWLDPRPAAFLELHIEQGPRLLEAGAPLGVVTSIAGTTGTAVSFTGRAGHAGTTPMARRADALAAAAEFMLALRDEAASIDDAVATVGLIEVAPGAGNVIPGRADLVVDARAPDRSRLDRLLAALDRVAHEAAERGECAVEVERRWYYEPTPMAERPQRALREAVHALGLPALELPSGAGHDAMVLGAAGVPAAMLFVRSSAGGVSHVPEEWTDEADVELAVDALTGALRSLAGVTIEPSILEEP